MLCAATLLLLVGVAVGCEPPAAQQWYSQNSILLLDRAQAGPPERNQRNSPLPFTTPTDVHGEDQAVSPLLHVAPSGERVGAVRVGCWESAPQVSLDLGRELPAC